MAFIYIIIYYFILIYIISSLENRVSPSCPSWERFYSNISWVLKECWVVTSLIVFPFQFGLSGWNSERHHQEKRCCSWTFVFDPSGRLVYYWSFIVSLAFLYNFWVSSDQVMMEASHLIITSGYHLQDCLWWNTGLNCFDLVFFGLLCRLYLPNGYPDTLQNR